MRAAGFSTLLLFAAPALTFLPGCTNLDETPTSAISPDKFYRNSDEVIGGLASVYASMRSLTEGYWQVTEVSTDEYIVPTRGSNWGDQGKWLDLHRQTFTPVSTGTSDNVNSAWNDLFRGVARANVVLAAMENVSVADKATIQAELRTLRAYYYFCLQDLFGGVPIVTDVEIKARAKNTRAEVFKFIEDELNATRLVLPDTWPATFNGRMTKGAANAILASLYINAEVFSGTVTVAGLTKGPAKWQAALDAANRIINSGQYSLANPWISNFTFDNGTSPEIIMAVKELNKPGLGLNMFMRTLHYNSLSTQSPWNGFATLAETYAAFDPADQRLQIFLSGQAYNLETGLPAKTSTGAPLIFTATITDPANAQDNEGIRVMKWPLDPTRVGTDANNDYGTFRLAEIYLIRAEAENELGSTPQAIIDLNFVRARVFSPAKPTTATTQAQVRDAIFNERLFELLSESKRRQDLIRAGKFLLPWAYKYVYNANGTCCAEPQVPRPAYKILFPIPQTQIETNPLLKQNDGY